MTTKSSWVGFHNSPDHPSEVYSPTKGPSYHRPVPSRLKRYHTFGHDHFITFSCYQRLPLLNNDRARTIFEETLEKLRARHGFYVFGLVLMPEHVHLLISEPKAQTLATTLSVLKRETSKSLKSGHPQFWQTRYYDFNILTQRKFTEKLRYIHRNPVERGLVTNPEDWPWSSYQHWLTGELGRVEIESHWTFSRRERSPPRCPDHPCHGCPIHDDSFIVGMGGVHSRPDHQHHA